MRFLFCLILLPVVGNCASVRGRVTDEGKYPIPNAIVRLALMADNREVATTRTDKMGTYVLNNVVAGKYSLMAAAEGFIGITYTPIQVHHGQKYDRDFRLPLAQGDEGGVWDNAKVAGMLEADGRRLAGAELCLASRAARACVTADQIGEYSLTVAPGEYSVVVRTKHRVWEGKIAFPQPGVYKDRIRPGQTVK